MLLLSTLPSGKDSFQIKFAKQVCPRDGRRIDQICLDQDCLSKWETAFYCKKCHEEHKQRNPKHSTSLDYIEALPNALEDRINGFIDSNSFTSDDYIIKIDEIYDKLQNFLIESLNRSKENVLNSIKSRVSNESIINSILDVQNKLNADQATVLEKEDTDSKLGEYCLMINNIVESLEGIINNIHDQSCDMGNVITILNHDFTNIRKEFQNHLDGIDYELNLTKSANVDQKLVNFNSDTFSKMDISANTSTGSYNSKSQVKPKIKILKQPEEINQTQSCNLLQQSSAFGTSDSTPQHQYNQQKLLETIPLVPQLRSITETKSVTLSNSDYPKCFNKIIPLDHHNPYIRIAFDEMLTTSTLTTKPVHLTSGCDGCGNRPIAGARYMCAICEDFDFCETCFNTKFHPHEFYLIDKLIQKEKEYSQEKKREQEDYCYGYACCCFDCCICLI